eukprot:3935352-Rhodomonas_salina.1
MQEGYERLLAVSRAFFDSGSPMPLRAGYVVSGTDAAYLHMTPHPKAVLCPYARATRCPALSWRVVQWITCWCGGEMGTRLAL